MRFLIVSTDYLEFQSWLYARYPGLDIQPYETQMQARMDSLFGTADFYSMNLRKLGHEAWDVIANLEPAQRQWARENGVAYNTGPAWRFRLRRGVVPWIYRDLYREWLYPILAAQVKAYRPDILYCMAVETVGSDFLNSVRDYYRLAVGQHAAPLPRRDLKGYDLMLSSLPNQVDYFRRQGMASELFRLGFEATVLTRLTCGGSRFDVAFAGGFGSHHKPGTRALEMLCRRFDVRVGGYGVDRLPAESPIRAAYVGPAWGIQMYQLLHDARIAFNRHIDIADRYANNMRMFEATGVGTLLVTDWKSNLHEMFEPGKEVVAYRSPEECVELVSHYLEHSSERQEIAQAGQRRTLREHTFYHRMQELVDIVRKYV